MTGTTWDNRPSGTVSFLFTDIEGSTRLWDEHPTPMAEALALHDGLVRKAIDRHDGHVFATGGDGFAAVFNRASDAASAAIELQVSLAEATWPAETPLQARAGLHSGEVHERDGDYFGPAVNQAARLMAAANGGQIVVSDVTASLIRGSDDIELLDLGPIQLKGVVAPVQAYGLVTSELPWRDRPISSTATHTGNLTRPATEFVGDLVSQRQAIAELRGARLVTLTGSGGVGKTRTAVEAAWMLEDEFPDGSWMVELAPISDPEAVIPALGSVLPLQAQPGMTVLESIVDWCRTRRMMLIVDNCEHVLDVASELVSAIVGNCDAVTVVATSREPLGVAGEQVVRIPSLDQHHSVELFCNRALAADSSFDPDQIDPAVISSICERVDGIPLAIELAAARVRVLHPTEILERLDDRFRLLRGGGRGGLERHQTLRATVSWSYQLLSELEQLLFDRLSVFAGSFDLADAEAVCADDQLDEFDVIDLLGELVDKSMVIADRGDDRTSYRLLETLRQYAEDRLDDRHETAELRDRHLHHFTAAARKLEQQQWSGDELSSMEAIGRCWGNLRSAHAWAIASSDVARARDLVDATAGYAVTRLNSDHLTWIDRTLELVQNDTPTKAFLLAGAAAWRFVMGDPAHAVEFAEHALELDDSPETVVMNRTFIIWGLLSGGRFEEVPAAVGRLTEALQAELPIRAELFGRMSLVDATYGTPEEDERLDDLGEVIDRSGSRIMQSTMARYRGMRATRAVPPRTEEAQHQLALAIQIADETSNAEQGCWARHNYAFAMRDQRDGSYARSLLEAFAFAEKVRHRLALASIIEITPKALLAAGDVEGAAVLAGFIALSQPAFLPAVETRQETQATLADDPATSEDQRNAWAAHGAELDLFAAVAYATGRLNALAVESPS